ncbi:hypothetical protein FJ548_08105 [Mesorhizobium sp. B2-4-17]|nr:hypothetical protein FJ548_08105 [Mesorhizobium sp. B2-4-17]
MRACRCSTLATARATAYEEDVGAAPHLPAGILSPYSDGERGARRRFRQSPTLKGASVAASYSLPVPIRGEMSGRTVRGGATPGEHAAAADLVALARRRLSVPGGDLRRLDLDAGEAGAVRPCRRCSKSATARATEYEEKCRRCPSPACRHPLPV